MGRGAAQRTVLMGAGNDTPRASNWTIGQSTGLTVGLVVALFGGVATTFVILLQFSESVREDLRGYVTKEQFEDRIAAVEDKIGQGMETMSANIEKGRAETRADIANLRADLLLKLAERGASDGER